MHVRSLIAGFLLGAVLGGAAAGLYMKTERSEVLPVQVIRVDTAEWRRIDPDSDLFGFRFAGRDFGSVSVKDGQLQDILLLDWPGRKQVSIERREGQLFGSLSFSLMDADNPYMARLQYLDDDADGLPDRKVEWENRTKHRVPILLRDEITWKPKPLTTATATNPA